jgi:predicted sulfurtransferase
LYAAALKKTATPSLRVRQGLEIIANKNPIHAEDSMNWRQFLTPVTSIDTDQAKSFLADKQVDDVTILDVRQPKEYEAGHIPGAILMPLPELTDHLQRIDRNKPVMVY